MVIAAHLAVINTFPQQSKEINKGFSIAMQVLGGSLVLYSINSTLGLMREESIYRVITKWFRDCPLWSKPKVVEVSVSATANASASLQARVKKGASSLTDRVTELERQVDEAYREMDRKNQTLKELISEVKGQLSTRIGGAESAIRGVEKKLDTTTLSGIKQQVFGVVVAVYGAGLGYFS
jgi:hypothetical protein